MTDYKTIETRADAFNPGRNKFRVGEVLRHGFRVWTRNLMPFTVLSLVLHAPFIVWAALLVAWEADPVLWHRFESWCGLSLHLVNALLSATVTYGVCMELEHRPASFARVIVNGLRRFLPALAVAALAGFAMIAAGLLLVVPGLIVMCMLYVAVPAAVIERPGVIGALRRSRALTAGNRPRIFGLALLVFGFNVIVTLIGHGIAFGFADDGEPLMSVSDLVRSVVFGPLSAALVATTYVLLRRQRDGVDTAALSQIFE